MTLRRGLAVGLTAATLVLLLVELAVARPGGGQSFSGGGGHGGSSGGGGGGGAIFELIVWLFRLIFYYPQVGLPLLGIIIGYFAYSAYKQHQNKDWDSGPPVELRRAVTLDDIKRVDPDFSHVLFEDFAFRLFSTAHRVRHSAETLATVAPYVSEAARDALATRAPAGVPVSSVVVGAMRVVGVEAPETAPDAPGQQRIGI
ncbi:MAG: putative rane protein, partial [Deltaproteobacteria bacterium]|nr:putative rane protein [Deltaproteobacteria bacterium]